MAYKVIHAVTISESLVFLKGQLKYLESQGYETSALCSEGDYVEKFEHDEKIKVLRLNMERDISLSKDLKSLIGCIRLIRKERPDIVNASTPKASLIVTLASMICGVPIRIYTMRGLRLETTRGIKRKILLVVEKIAASSATHCLAVSESLKEQVVELGIAPANKISILGKGSGDGFNIAKFKTGPIEEAKKDQLKMDYGIAKNDIVLGFTGRLTKDKGIEQLVQAFQKLNKIHPSLKLLIVGNYDESDPVPLETRIEIQKNPNIIHAGFQKDPIPFFRMMNVFVFLTKREGFGNVSIEAALCGVPVLVSDVTGARDTIVDGKSGFLVDNANDTDILEKLELLILAPELRKQMGDFGRRWAEENFSDEKIWRELNRYYESCLAECLQPVRQSL